jgi:hypothetical protein
MVGKTGVSRRQRKGTETKVKGAGVRRKSAGRMRAEFAKAAYLGIAQVLDRLPGNKLRPIKTAFEAGKPMTALALIAAEIKPAADDDFVIDDAHVRGAKLKEDLVEKAGGLLSSKKAAEVLGISPRALHKRLSKGSLVALQMAGGGLGYPAFQFENDLMQAGISAVVKAINVNDPWAILSFLFLRLGELEGRTPVEAIRKGKADAAAQAARHFGKHGAS